MNQFPSSSFEWTSMTDKEYRETNNSCFSDLFENVAARCTYPSLALVAIIETVGSAAAALFVSISIPFSGEKKRAFSLWQRSAFSGLAITLDVLGFFSPGLTSKGITHITSRFFHENKEKEQVTPANAASNSEEVEEIEELQGLEKKKEQLEIGLLAQCNDIVSKKIQEMPTLSTNLPQQLQTYLLNENGYNSSSNVNEKIEILENLIAGISDRADPFFTQILKDRMETNQKFLDNWKATTLYKLVKEAALKFREQVFADTDVSEQLISQTIDIVALEQIFNVKLEPEMFALAIERNVSWYQKRLEARFERDFWRERVVDILGLTHLLEENNNADTAEKEALEKNLPKLVELLRFGEKQLYAKVNGRDEIVTAKEIKTKINEIFVSSVKEKACQPDAEIPEQLHEGMEQASEGLLSPIRKENEATLQEHETKYDSWARRLKGYDPENPPSLTRLTRWDMRSATIRMQPRVYRQRVEEVFATHTNEAAKDELLAANSEKVTWAQNYTKAQSSVLVSNEHQNVATILELGRLLKLDEKASMKEYQEGTALLNNLPKLIPLYKTTVETIESVLTAEQPTADEIKEIADSIFRSRVKKEACQAGGNLQILQDQIKQEAGQILKSIRESGLPESRQQENERRKKKPLLEALREARQR